MTQLAEEIKVVMSAIVHYYCKIEDLQEENVDVNDAMALHRHEREIDTYHHRIETLQSYYQEMYSELVKLN